MNEVEYKYMKATIQSLTMASDGEAFHRNVKMVFSRRNSPYISHRTVEFFKAEEMSPPLKGEYVFMNRRFALVIRPSNERDADQSIVLGGYAKKSSQAAPNWVSHVCRPVQDKVPGWMLRGFIPLVRFLGGNLVLQPVEEVRWFIPVISRWEEDSRPVFVFADE